MSQTRVLALEELEPRGVYRLISRNLSVGVFDGNIGFIGIREKFGDLYLFREYHYDHGGVFGTVRPLEKIGVLDEGIAMRETLGSMCSVCEGKADYVKWVEGEKGNGYGGRWCHVSEDLAIIDEGESHRIEPHAIPNPALFDALKAYEDVW